MATVEPDLQPLSRMARAVRLDTEGTTIVLRFRYDTERLLRQIEEMEDAVRAAGNQDLQFCKGCFEGTYPTGDITDAMVEDIENDRVAAGSAT